MGKQQEEGEFELPEPDLRRKWANAPFKKKKKPPFCPNSQTN